MNKKMLIKILYIFLSIHPLMDLLTALMTRFEISIISVGIIFRGLFFLLMLIYLFIFSSSKYKRKSIKYLLVLLLFCILYFLTKTELILNKSFFINEIIYMFKYMYFPVVLITLLNLYNESNIDRKKIINIFIFNLMAYAILIIIPFITNTGFKSYAQNKGIGVVGWFFSANEIGVILGMIFPLLFLYINKKINIRIVISLVLVLISAILIGTKVAFFGCASSLIVVLIYYLVNHKKYKKEHFILPIILLVLLALLSSNLPVFKNINHRIDMYNNATEKENKETKSSEIKQEKKQEKPTKNSDIPDAKFILSSRDKLFSNIYEIYKTRPMKEKLFGIGFNDRTDINNIKIKELVEMDFFDIVLRYGIIGLIIYVVPLIIIGITILKHIINIKFKLSIEQILYLYSILIGVGAGFIAGHVFSSPPVSIYIALLMIFSLDIFKAKKKKKLDKENIYFLSLHLGQGGIERATINTANALCEKKKVTIISFYNLGEELYDIDPRVNIKYIYNGRPNREEWKGSIKNKNIFLFIKNSIKAVSILLKKKYLMIREIRKIKDGIIISTTIDFSILLNYYGRDNVLKVVQEHRYHNNDKKYLRKMKYNYGNIDYIMALTNKLLSDYEELFIENNKIKVVLMPNMMSNISYTKSTLNNHVIVSINRLDKGKRVNEIIDIAKKLKKTDWKFKLIGDGEERENLQKQIKDLKLESTVELLGKLPNKEALDILSESSIYVMTSITEGFAMTLIEACSVGLPCVCYEIENDLSDIIKDNENGFIIKNRNEKEIVKKLKLLMENDSKRKTFGKKSIIVAKKYTCQEITNKWLDFINRASL